jgi:hypothetical protein
MLLINNKKKDFTRSNRENNFYFQVKLEVRPGRKTTEEYLEIKCYMPYGGNIPPF